ncbi:MAG: alpha-2-macroglobulin family protein, partial [Chloroflexota bacterium]
GIQIPFKSDGSGLPAGLYAFRIESPQFESETAAIQLMLVVSPVKLTLKESQGEMVVWAVNHNDQRPVAGRLVSVFEVGSGLSLGRGETDADGVARIALPPRERYRSLLVTLGESNDADFSAAVTSWNAGLYPWNFGIHSTLDQPHIKAYGYTDRPIYQPGQTVYYRYIVRQWGDARYQPVDLGEVSLKIFGAYTPDLGNPVLETRQLPVSAYGTVEGQFTLPADAPAGIYTMQLDEKPDSVVEFRVAAYRKPEIDLNVEFNQKEYLAGQDVQAQVEAAYFFDAPASGVKVDWSLYVRDAFLDLPEGYTSGAVDTSWLEVDWWMQFDMPLGQLVQNGSGVTGSDGRFPLTFLKENLAQFLALNREQMLTLEVTLMDESGFPISRRGQTLIHPADFVIGVRPQSWVQAAEMPYTFSIATFDWQNRPSGNRALSASFDRVEWVQDFNAAAGGAAPLKQVVTGVSGADLRTDANGRAALQFTPPAPGIYRLEVRGGGALTQVLVWVGGAGRAPWPLLPNQQLRLESEQKAYPVGQTARVFVPNPLSPGALAWVTIERRGVLRSQVLTISGSSQVLDIPLTESDAPNVFVAVTLLGNDENGKPDFRQGYLELEVDAQALELDVSIIPLETRYEPRQTARFDVLVKDHLGNPIQGEFSLAVVDKAVLALADSTVKDIREAFYGAQPLGVYTSGSMAAHVGRIPLLPPGLGGGGGGAADALSPLRSDFRDTAYWIGSLETDASGRGQIEFTLPDNLTTWVATLRGVTRDTRVGEAVTEIVVSKDLLVRPVTPRFLVAGDRVEIGAVVQNNTSKALEATVRLQANGISLENPALERQAVQLPANGRQRVSWWVRVGDTGSAAMVFSVEGGGMQDASTIPSGNLPVLRYSSLQSFTTGGVLAEAGEVLEVVSLPRSFTPTGGELRVELAANLAGAILADLEMVEDDDASISEPLLSRLLANLTVFELSREINLSSPDLNARLQESIRRDLDRLAQMQKTDGGWGWIPSMSSDLYLSAYALWMLDKAAANGFFVAEFDRQDANRFVTASLYTPEMTQDATRLDQLAFMYFVLNQHERSQPVPADLLGMRARLSPWAQALLALAVQTSQPDAAATLIADLAGSAQRSASGTFWQPRDDSYFGFSNTYANSAIVLLALVKVDPASPLVADAVRYLVLQRGENGWLNSHATAWVLAALSQAAHAMGEFQGNYSFNATLNGAAIANGEATGAQTSMPVRATVALSQLSAASNALRIQRSAGSGRLYYRAILDVGQPVETVQALDGGITLSREYFLAGADCGSQDCPAVQSASRSTSNPVVHVRLALTVPNDMTYLVVEDYIPAGAEIVDTTLNTTQLGSEEIQPLFVDGATLANGWGWWYFTAPRISADRIRWLGSYVPAGTYILTYRILPLQAGEFRVLPARAYAMYFPDVQGRSAGSVFTIE